MTLPETGETSPDLGTLSLADDSEQIQAETIAFGQAQDLTAGAVTETTAAMSVAEIKPALGSADATLVMGPELSSDLGVSPSGIPLGSGTRRARPSTQDLDAVKELLGSKTPARPTSAKIPTDHWEPVLSSAGRPSREREGLAGLSQKPLVRQVGGALLLVAVLALGWLAYEVNRNTARPAPARAPSPSAPIPSPATVAEGSGGVPTSAPEPSAAATAPAASAPAPAASASAAVVTTPAPLPPTTPTPRATPTPTPKPPVSVATPTPAPAPAAAARPATTGRLADAASIFAAAARSRAGEFSVQLVVACSAQTIEKALQNDPSPDLFVLPATVSGKACHRLMRGFYRTGAEAEQAVASLPPYYVAEGAKPRAIAVKAVLP
jgi:septal ring-binding cell division protein DamX